MSTAELIIFLMIYCSRWAVFNQKRIVYVPDVEYKPFLFGSETYAKDWVAHLNPTGIAPRYILLNYTDEEITDRETDDSYLRGHGEVWFYLYTNTNPRYPEQIKGPGFGLSNIKPEAPFFILIPGWVEDVQSNFSRIVKQAILEKYGTNDVNIIIMDWYNMQCHNYMTTAQRTYDASKKLKWILHNIIEKYRIESELLHIVGNCLGAHVGGLTGKQLQREDILVYRVTGLDPARPYFEYPRLYEGISQRSALFVDIIHTSNNILGITKPAGHADFYPNGGTVYQPVCCPKRTPGLPGACEHDCAYIYYANSFKYNYESARCERYLDFRDRRWDHRYCDLDERQFMGEPANDTARGLYFLDILPDED